MAASAIDGRLIAGTELTEPLALSLAGGEVVLFSSASPQRNGANEDAALALAVRADLAVLAVADGVGGQPRGAAAARLALECLERALAAPDARSSAFRTAILDALDTANRRLLDDGVGSATTFAAVEITGRSLRTYHVGDSTILVTGLRGRIKLQTVAHSPVGYAVESGLLAERDALHHDARHLVSNAVGSADMRVEVGSPLALSPRDTVLLGTDGLFDNLAVAEAVELARRGPLVAAAARLAERCRRRMAQPDAGTPSKPDDLTFILYRPRTRA